MGGGADVSAGAGGGSSTGFEAEGFVELSVAKLGLTVDGGGEGASLAPEGGATLSPGLAGIVFARAGAG